MAPEGGSPAEWETGLRRESAAWLGPFVEALIGAGPRVLDRVWECLAVRRRDGSERHS